MTKKNERAHYALEEWASFHITMLTSQELGYQQAQLEVERVQTPPKALIPRVTFTPHIVKAIDNWYEATTDSLRWTAKLYYLGDISEKRRVSRGRRDYLIDMVSMYLTGLCK